MSRSPLDEFAAFCRLLTLDNGRRMILEDFQQTILSDYFAGTARETLALLAKGAGKTTLLSAAGLFELLTVPDAEITIAAAARDQAAIMMRQAQGFVRRADGLRSRLVVRQREIVHRELGGRLRILAADADTGDGVLPTLALCDELHRWRGGELYSVLRDSLSKRSGRMVTISTAGSEQDGPLWRTRQAALERGAVRDGAYLRGGGDSSLALHEWSLVEGRDDPDDMQVVKLANPASWVTIETLRERHDSPLTTPWDWRRFACNLWSSAQEPWLPPGAWDACRSDLEIPDGARAVLGIDIGRKHDSSAIVACAALDDRTVVRAWVFASPGSGAELTDLGAIEGKLRDLAGHYDVRECAYDPWSFTRSAQLLADEGLPMVEFPQSHARMAPASARLHEAISAGRIAHNGDPVLAAHVAAGAATETPRGWRLTKRGAGKIDSLIALCVALDRCDFHASQKPKTYVAFGYYEALSASEKAEVDRLVDVAMAEPEVVT